MLGIFKNQAQVRLDDWQVIDIRDERSTDLPCPWCFAPTRENDATCPSCSRRFG